MPRGVGATKSLDVSLSIRWVRAKSFPPSFCCDQDRYRSQYRVNDLLTFSWRSTAIIQCTNIFLDRSMPCDFRSNWNVCLKYVGKAKSTKENGKHQQVGLLRYKKYLKPLVWLWLDLTIIDLHHYLTWYHPKIRFRLLPFINLYKVCRLYILLF